jgi:hypothetical protein
MNMLLADFRVRFPEFFAAPDAYVQSYLTAALARMDPTVWGTLLDEGQAYLCAHLMAITPAGFTSGFSTSKGESSYGTEYLRLVRIVAGGPALAGDPKGQASNTVPWPFC